MQIDRLMRSACRKAGICLCGQDELPQHPRKGTGRNQSRVNMSTRIQLFRLTSTERTVALSERCQQTNRNRALALLAVRTVAQRSTTGASNQGTNDRNPSIQGQPPPPRPLLPPPPPPLRQPASERLAEPASRNCTCIRSCLSTLVQFFIIMAMALMVILCTYHLGANVNSVGNWLGVRQLWRTGKLAIETVRFGYHLFIEFLVLSRWTPNRTMSDPNEQINIGPSHNTKPHQLPPDSSREVNQLRLIVKRLEQQLINASQILAASQQGNKTVLDEAALTQRILTTVETRLIEVTKQELIRLGAAFKRLSAEVALNRQLANGSTLKAEGASRMLTERLEQLQKQVASLKPSQSLAIPEICTSLAPSASVTPEADELPDFALESAGASVFSTRETRAYRTSYWWLQQLWSVPSLPGPSIVLTPTIQPGTCWAFVGFPGKLVVKLSHPIRITAISIDHLSKQQSYTDSLSSAPREFVAYGLTSGCESTSRGNKLGSFIFSAELGPPTQTFRLAEPTQQVYEYVELVILSNHGNFKYTCLYRFRVHGRLS